MKALPARAGRMPEPAVPDVTRAAHEAWSSLQRIEASMDGVRRELAAVCVQLGHAEAAQRVLARAPAPAIGYPAAVVPPRPFGAAAALPPAIALPDVPPARALPRTAAAGAAPARKPKPAREPARKRASQR
jgi:hypothetical protein